MILQLKIADIEVNIFFVFQLMLSDFIKKNFKEFDMCAEVKLVMSNSKAATIVLESRDDFFTKYFTKENIQLINSVLYKIIADDITKAKIHPVITSIIGMIFVK